MQLRNEFPQEIQIDQDKYIGMNRQVFCDGCGNQLNNGDLFAHCRRDGCHGKQDYCVNCLLMREVILSDKNKYELQKLQRRFIKVYYNMKIGRMDSKFKLFKLKDKL
jgi:late competence protein required for DNA uptake (superfamily II DNA/RNA helicase)